MKNIFTRPSRKNQRIDPETLEGLVRLASKDKKAGVRSSSNTPTHGEVTSLADKWLSSQTSD